MNYEALGASNAPVNSRGVSFYVFFDPNQITLTAPVIPTTDPLYNYLVAQPSVVSASSLGVSDPTNPADTELILVQYASFTLSPSFPGNPTTLFSVSYTASASFSGSTSIDVIGNANAQDPDFPPLTPSSLVLSAATGPVISAPSSVSLNENQTFTFSSPNAISVTDTAGSGNDNVTMTLSVGNGTLSLGTQTSLTVSGSGTTASPLSLTGSLSDLNADLPSLVYTPTSGINGTDDLELTILDNTDSLSGTSVQVGITINPLPLLSAPAGVTVTANGTFTFSSPNNIIVTDTAGAGNNNETLTLTVADGTLSLGTQTGLTVSGNGTTATPLTLSGPLSDLNADLTSLVYTPNSNFHGSDTLSLTILDTTDGAEGTPATVSITVNIVLNQPSVTNTTTVENTQSTTGLVITPNALDTAFVTDFQITNITGGTLYSE